MQLSIITFLLGLQSGRFLRLLTYWLTHSMVQDII